MVMLNEFEMRKNFQAVEQRVRSNLDFKSLLHRSQYGVQIGPPTMIRFLSDSVYDLCKQFAEQIRWLHTSKR